MHWMKDNQSHDETGAVKLNAKLSSNVYVSVRLRDEPAETGQLLLMAADKCNHGITICPECAEGWEWDYIVHYDRTQAGRKLLELRKAIAQNIIAPLVSDPHPIAAPSAGTRDHECTAPDSEPVTDESTAS